MNTKSLARLAPVAMIAFLLTAPAAAQPPSAVALSTARELVELKGGQSMFDPVIIGIVEQTKGALLQSSPQLSKDLNDVSAALRGEFAARRGELFAEAAKFYAQKFTEAELKDLLTFFKTPLGRKMVVQEPQALDDTFKFVEQWAPKLGEDVMNRFRAEMKKKGHNL
jgi:uncharacterized protein